MKKAIIFFCCFVLIICAVPVTQARALYNQVLETIPHYADIILLESLDDGSVIFEKNADVVTPPASFTKIITAAIVLKNCKNLNTVITVPEYTIRMLDGTNSSNVGLKPGEKISVLNLLYCLLVPSANDAATVLADYVAGNMDKFVDMMNDYVKSIGCRNTHFVNPHGLDEDGQKTTANDMMKIVKEAMKIPLFVKITSNENYSVPATNLSGIRKLNSTVLLMNEGYKDYYCKYASGIKTGSTTGAGRCVISKASKDGYSYLAVIMKAPFEDIDKDGVNENCALVDCKTLFNWTFDNIKLRTVARSTQIISEVPVKLSWSVDHVQLMPKEDVLALVPSGINAGSVLIDVVEKSVPESINAPVKKGQEIAQARVLYAGEEITRITLVSGEDVDRSLILFIGSLVRSLASTVAFKIIAAVLFLFAAAFACLILYSRLHRRKRKRLRVLNYRDIQGK